MKIYIFYLSYIAITFTYVYNTEASHCEDLLLTASVRVTDDPWPSNGWRVWSESVCWSKEVGVID